MLRYPKANQTPKEKLQKAWGTIPQDCLKKHLNKVWLLGSRLKKWGVAQDFCTQYGVCPVVFLYSGRKADSVFRRKTEILEIHCKEMLRLTQADRCD